MTASVAFGLCETPLFAGLRDWVKARSAWLGKLACCGYCLGHWIAFGLVAVYRPTLFEAWWLLDYFLTALVIAWLTAFQSILAPETSNASCIMTDRPWGTCGQGGNGG